MSGTSMDGLDIALCRISGSGRNTRLKVEQFQTAPYTARFRSQLKAIFAQPTISQQQLCTLNAIVGRTHGTLVNNALTTWGIANHQVDLVASHGQTVFHAPQWQTGHADEPNSTLQIGDGDHVAVSTGIITVTDFRQKHIAMGGEGAPLAVYGDYLLFSAETENRILLNIGGIANFTYLPASTTGQQAFATDTGPGNTLMDQYMQQYFGREMDYEAQVALSGKVHPDLLRALQKNRFFSLPFPKTTGPELFNLEYIHKAQQDSATASLEHRDVMATLTAFSAIMITRAIQEATGDTHNVHLYLSGGGLHNPMLRHLILQGLPHVTTYPFEQLKLSPDAKEAALFAVLANETVAGHASNTAAIGYSPRCCMGKICFPE